MSVIKIAEYHYMHHFIQVYRELMEVDGRTKADLLLRSFMKGKGSKQAEQEEENAFLRTCEQLVDLHCESLILEFMVGVFLEPQVYDREKLYECLKRIQVTETKDLAEWCAEFFLSMDAQRRKLYLHDEREFRIDLYHEDYDTILDLKTHSWADTAKWIAEYVYDTKYQEPFYMYEVEESLIDRIASLATTPCGVIGLLQPLYRALEVSGCDELCYYILSRYVMDAFGKVEWRSEWIPRVRIMAVLFNIYGHYFYSLSYKKDEKMSWRALKKEYTEGDYLREASGAADGYYITAGKKLYQRYPGIAFGLTVTLHSGADVLRRTMPEWLMSFFFAYTPYVQLCTGKPEWVGRFLMEHFDEIRVEDRRRLYFQITLARVILKERDLAIASGLCAQYDYEMDRASRRGSVMQAQLKRAIQFMKDAKTYLCEDEKYDVLYQDQRINWMMDRIQMNLNDGEEMAENDVWQLMSDITAFTKLSDALPQELVQQGRKILDYREELEAYYLSRWDGPVRKSVSVILHDHLSELMKKTVADSSEQMADLKKQYFKTNPHGNQMDNKVLMDQLDQVCERLNSALSKETLSRPEIVTFVHEARRRFMDMYVNEDTERNILKNLSPKYETTVFDYLVTSETVFRYLSNQASPEKYDYSPALISLTKALELILDYVYSQMDVRWFRGLSEEKEKKYFRENGERKKKLELGPYIEILRDSQMEVSGKGSQRDLYVKHRIDPRKSTFVQWNGDAVLDISKLSSLTAIPITMSTKDVEGKWVGGSFYFQDGEDDYNRHLLVQGLDYIRSNYRNRVAHKDILKMVSVEECRDLLIMTENLLWILLYIIRPQK